MIDTYLEAKASLSRDIVTEIAEPQERGSDGRFAPSEPPSDEPVETASEDTMQDDRATESEAIETAPEEGERDDPVSDDTAQDGEAIDASDADAVPEGHVVLEIPEGHPLRDRGKDSLPPIPAEWENDFRRLLNEPVRRAEVDEAVSARLDAENQREQAWAVAEHYAARTQAILSDPQTLVTILEAAETLGENGFKTFVDGLVHQDENALNEKLTKLQTSSQERALTQEADRFVKLARADLATTYPSLTPQESDKLIAGYASLLEAGYYDSAHASTFRTYVKGVVSNDPRLAAKAQEKPMDRDTLKKELLEEIRREEKARAEAHRQKRSEIPLSGATTPLGTRATGSGSPAQANKGMSVMEARRSLGTAPLIPVTRR